MNDRKASEAPIRVAAISGSSRKGSYNTALLREAKVLAPQGMLIEICDISNIPFYNEDVRLEGYPSAVTHFRSVIAASDGLLIASPEYNRSVPGGLKNAIDWASRRPDQPFDGKPIAIMGVSNGALGAAFANYHLRQIFVFLNGRMLNGAEVMIGNAKSKFDENGRLIDQNTRDFVATHLRRLATLIRDSRQVGDNPTAAEYLSHARVIEAESKKSAYPADR
jgi:chromate reductase, NAD(P)H dehydrogenase (quinone)